MLKQYCICFDTPNRVFAKCCYAAILADKNKLMKLLKFIIAVIFITRLDTQAYAQPSLSKMKQLIDKEELQQAITEANALCSSSRFLLPAQVL